MAKKIENENQPQKKYATTEQVAYTLNISQRWVQRLVKEQGMPREEQGKFNLIKVVRWYVEFLRNQIDEAKKGNENLDEAKLRLTKLKADREEVELSKEHKSLIPVKVCEEIMLSIIILFGKKIDALPSKILNKLFAAKTKKELFLILTNATEELRNELAGTDIRLQLSDSTGDTKPDNKKHP
jgi:phage terminase Nu1 subunit (DNA packaging protein)